MLTEGSLNASKKITDEDIIRMLEERNDAVLPILESRFGAGIRSISRGILENEADADECLNDVLLKLWNNIPPSRPDNLGAYVKAVARNNAIDRYKAQRNGGKIPPEKQEPLESADNIGVWDIDPADKEAVAALIAQFLRGVSQEKRNYFIAKFYYGMKESEIAKNAGVPEGTVSSAVSRMRKELKKFLKAEKVR